MSGTPKYSSAQLAQQQQERLEAERRQKAAAEAKLRAAAAAQAVGEIEGIIAGLKADPVVMRWHPHSVLELEKELQQAAQAVTSAQFALPAEILTKARAKERQMIEEANTAQLKADRRDYIAQSIVSTLQEMGFSILSVDDEHSGHPATAKIFRAAAAGRAISVSVPVEGQVWYDVDGYPKATVASVANGNPTAICDEAEQVLTEMHSALQNEFGVQMGEVTWQGKDPNRNTRTATELPSNARQTRGDRG
jgi:hypothetical protein